MIEIEETRFEIDKREADFENGGTKASVQRERFSNRFLKVR